MQSDTRNDLGPLLEQLSGLLGDDGGRTTERLVALAARAMSVPVSAGVTVVLEGRRPRSVATTSEVVDRVEALQQHLGQGPGWEAALTQGLVAVTDLAEDRRWPRFAEQCVATTGLRSVIAVHLPLGGADRAALTLYSPEPRALSREDQRAACLLGPFLALAVRDQLSTERADHLDVALRSSRQIGTAIGILMARRLLTADEAFEELKTTSQHLNRKLRDIAEQVQLTGELPPRSP